VKRRLAALALAGHGAIHLIGFVVPWKIATVDGFAYRTSVLGSSFDVGDAGARALGIAWAIVAAAFVATAVAAWRHARTAPGAAASAAVASCVICALWLPETAAGMAVDVAIVAAAGLATRRAAALRPI
jgi:hypothetical protein